jgi:hypothetical protein
MKMLTYTLTIVKYSSLLSSAPKTQQERRFGLTFLLTPSKVGAVKPLINHREKRPESRTISSESETVSILPIPSPSKEKTSGRGGLSERAGRFRENTRWANVLSLKIGHLSTDFGRFPAYIYRLETNKVKAKTSCHGMGNPESGLSRH